MGGMRGKGKTMKKIIDSFNTTRNQIIENLIDTIVDMFPESGSMFLKEKFTKRGYKILSLVFFEGGFNIDVKSPKGDIISLRIMTILSKEARYRIWNPQYNLVSDCVVQYIN